MADAPKPPHAPDGAPPEGSAGRWEVTARRYEEVHDRSPDGMMMFRAVRDAGGQIVDFEWLYSNPSASRIVGRAADNLLGKRLLVEMPGNREAGLFDVYCRVVEVGEPHSHEFSYRHEGLDSWFRATSIKLGDGFYVAFSDLTVRKRAEEQAARLAAIVRSSDHAIYSVSDGEIIDTWNRGAEKLYGYASAEIIGQSVLLTVPADRRAEREEAMERIAARGGVESLQTVRVTKSGRLVPVSITLSPIAAADGRRVGTAILARDISEEVKLQERLILANRMVSVGTLAAGIAHEVNNPLAYVIANLDLVLEEIPRCCASAEGRSELEARTREARSGAERIRNIVRGLMRSARGAEERRTVVDLRSVLEQSIVMAFNEIRNGARVVTEYGDAPHVLADEARLAQVFVNLLVNAAQAVARDGAAGEQEIRVVTSTDDACRAVVEISDTGLGIPTEDLPRVFDPFFTTKAVGGGTGLGLSICRNIVGEMGGEIRAANRGGGGASFLVILPAAVRAPDVAPRPETEAPAAARRGAVLIVDDEPVVGGILRRLLRDHDVTVTTKATEALALLSSGARFDVVISDLMMPEMSGMELYDELARSHPEAAERVVFASGGAFTPAASAFLDRVPNERFEKPFDAAHVRALVQRFVRR